MSEARPRHEITLKTLVCEVPNDPAITVRRDIPYSTGDLSLTMDVYYPPGVPRAGLPAALMVIGYSDVGARAMLGCPFKDMESFAGWARLIAAAGTAAIVYTTGMNPAADLRTLLQYLREPSDLGIDGGKIVVWASSGHGPNAFQVLMRDVDPPVRAAALCYAFTLDLDGATNVSGAAGTFRFVNPCAGRSVADLSPEIPLFVARCGRDETPGLNTSLDRFVARALSANLPVTVVNHPEAPHAFDLMHDSDASRALIADILTFVKRHSRP